VARGQFGKNFTPAVLGGTNGATPLNDSKNAAGFAARANALTAFGIYRGKSEQNDGVAVLEESGGSVSVGELCVLQNRLQE